MATEQNSQHQHAQWLASLASDHFVQQTIGAVAQEDVSPVTDSQPADDDTHIVDISGQAVVKLVAESVVTSTSVPSIPTSPFNLRKKRKVDRDETRHEEFKVIPSKDRSSAKNFDMRRPVRPIDRQKMRPWLKNLLDAGSVFGLNWVQREEGVFQISWRHASRLGWNLETDGDVFERWARHTGIFKDGDEPEPKRWKANFRCALHSLPDVKELTSPTDRKGRNASRTYRFLRSDEVHPPLKRKHRYNIQIPYVYERQASEDSGSQHAESDDRNSEEELFSEQVRAFPHCDHDYAIRSERPEEEQSRTSEILPRHNSGYVLIKSKDAHEFEFRLTPPDSTPKPSNPKRSTPAPKSSSPQKKAKMGKKRTISGNSPAKKGKGKTGQKVGIMKKDKRQVKKIKKSGEKEVSPATKVSLKTLLSGYKNSAGAKRTKAGQGVSQVSKKAVKGGKKVSGAAAKGKGKKEGTGSGSGTPTQSQGLQALLEAAVQIDRMDFQTSASATPPTNTKTASPAGSKRRRATPASVTAVLTPAAAPVFHTTTTSTAQPTLATAPTAVAVPIIFAPQTLVAAGATTRTVVTPHPVLVPAPAIMAPSPVPSQESISMLQKYLGLSAVPASAVSPIHLSASSAVAGQSVSSTTVDSQVDAKSIPVTTGSQVFKSSKNGEVLPSRNGDVSVAPATPLLMTQPEAGTSMLKHLLRLTGPSVTKSSITATTPSPASHIIPAAPQVLTPLISTPSTAGEIVRDLRIPDEPVVKLEPDVTAVADKIENSDDQNELRDFKIVAEYELGNSQEGPSQETDNKAFPYIRVSTSKVYIKPEAIEAAEEAVSLGSSVTDGDHPAVSLPQTPASATAAHSTAVLQSGERTLVSAPALQTSVTQAVVQITPTSASVSGQQMTVPAPQSSSCAPQVTLCLPQMMNVSQTQQASASGAQTMTVTLPQTTFPVSQGQAVPTTTYTQSMDIWQFLNLFAASGNNQVIIKRETPIPSDLAAMSSAYNPENIASSSQTEGDTAVGPKFILVDTSLQTPAAVSSVPSEGQPQAAGGQIVVSLANPVLSAGVNNLVVSTAAASPDLTTPMNTVSASDIDDDEPPVLSPQVVLPTEDGSESGVEVVTNQFIMNEADISSLSEDRQGTDSFVVENIL